MGKLVILGLIVFSTVFLQGCVTGDYRYTNFASANLIAQNNRAVSAISQQLHIRQDTQDLLISPILMMPIVNIKNPNQTSAFGYLVTEQVAAKLSQLNYDVVEVNAIKTMAKGHPIEIKVYGELKEVIAATNTKAVITGTYTENDNDVFITIKVVDPSNWIVLAAHSYAVPNAHNIAELLADEIYLTD